MWVCIGVVGPTDTNAQSNSRKRDRNGLEWYDSRPCMAGKFPPKRHICVCKHKRVKRDSGGWAWVRMGSGGCIGTQQTQNKTNRGTNRSQDIILASVRGGKLIVNDVEVGTWPPEIM